MIVLAHNLGGAAILIGHDGDAAHQLQSIDEC